MFWGYAHFKHGRTKRSVILWDRKLRNWGSEEEK